MSFPGVDLAAEPVWVAESPVWVADSAVQALAAEHADLDLGHVEPTGMLGGVVELQAAQNPPGSAGANAS